MRRLILRAALEHIEELAEDDELPDYIADRLRAVCHTRLEERSALVAPDLDGDDGVDSELLLTAGRGTGAAQRAGLGEPEGANQIGSRAAREVEREFAGAVSAREVA